MPRIHTLSDIGECKKLGDIPSNRYPPSRTELENQLACANRDREIAIECGNRLANKCSVLDKDNKRIQLMGGHCTSESKNLAKYFKSKTLPIITNKQNPESLIQDITIKGAVCAGEALVNDKYQIPPIISEYFSSTPAFSVFELEARL
ncbi:221_t:CDS:2 [Ambispora leptoticha]|uniref:221_t:CDS:1 n=1 Tax=Ambispora leptoticha TaxID=144679 RepID=A0A9N9FUN7_9GLOM|nr:221_t:CDS:2 [Ambispora leptoticha]